MRKADENQSGVIFNIQKFSVNDGPGIRTVVFLKGCPLRCRWCANPESQANGVAEAAGAASGAANEAEAKVLALPPEYVGKRQTVREVLDVVMQDEVFYEESGGGITLSGGELLMQPDFAEELLLAAKERRLHTCCETTGFASVETFDRVIGLVDYVLFDFKHWDSAKHREGTGVPNERILSNMKRAAAAGKEVLPRLPVIPGFNDSLEDAAHFASCLLKLGLSRIQLLPFHQFGENKYDKLGVSYTYKDVAALHPEDLEDYRRVFTDTGMEAFF